MHDKQEHTCYLCMLLHSEYSTQTGLEEHHVFYGSGKRALSEKYGLKVYLCSGHHRDSIESIHHNTANNRDIDLMLKERGQQAFEEHYPKLSFIEIFGKNYSKNLDLPQCERDFNPNQNGFIEVEDWMDEKTKRMVNI